MSECGWCGQTYDTASCCKYAVSLDGTDYPAIPWGEETRGVPDAECCPDCGVAKGGYHHELCDWEECPVCHGQKLGCFCDGEDVKETTR